MADLFGLLKVEDGWSTDTAGGFTWWPNEFSQSVWTDLGVYHNGQTVYRLHAETDLIRSRDSNPNFEVELERGLGGCTCSALIHDQKSEAYRLHTSIYFHADNVDYFKRLFAAAAALQINEADQAAHLLAEKAQARPAISEHPRSGLRNVKHPMIGNIVSFFRPLGMQPSRWSDAREWEEVWRIVEREAMHFESDRRTQAKALFFWEATQDGPIELIIQSSDAHSVLGNGLHMVLSVPMPMPAQMIVRLALELNNEERRDWKRCHMVGSWNNIQDRLAYECFIPNTVYNQELLPRLTTSMCVRAQWVNEFFLARKAEATGRR